MTLCHILPERRGWVNSTKSSSTSRVVWASKHLCLHRLTWQPARGFSLLLLRLADCRSVEPSSPLWELIYMAPVWILLRVTNPTCCIAIGQSQPVRVSKLPLWRANFTRGRLYKSRLGSFNWNNYHIICLFMGLWCPLIDRKTILNLCRRKAFWSLLNLFFLETSLTQWPQGCYGTDGSVELNLLLKEPNSSKFLIHF